MTNVKFISEELSDQDMPLRLDRVDVSILRALMEDGRRSYRQIARMTGVSTPTVEARIRRMYGTGFIKRISPVFDPEKTADGITALVTFRVDYADIPKTAKDSRCRK